MELDCLGPYQLVRKLGRGGMGVVYEGVDVETGQRAALKVLSAPLSEDQDFRIRFETEIETLRRLKHPNIVRLFGFGQQEGLLFYAMELVDGPSLEAELRRGRRFGWQEAAQIGLQICRGLRHAHDRGIIHRDLKPGNLLLAADGTVKLADFGIAQLFGRTRVTAVGSVVGTLDYMAPEQAQGSLVDARADLYSLGAVLYTLLSGRPPLHAKTLSEMLEKLYRTRPEPIRRLAPEVPEAFEQLLEQLLEKEPQRRMATAQATARRLETLLQEATGKGGYSTPLGTETDDQAESVPAGTEEPVLSAGSAIGDVLGRPARPEGSSAQEPSSAGPGEIDILAKIERSVEMGSPEEMGVRGGMHRSGEIGGSVQMDRPGEMSGPGQSNRPRQPAELPETKPMTWLPGLAPAASPAEREASSPPVAGGSARSIAVEGASQNARLPSGDISPFVEGRPRAGLSPGQWPSAAEGPSSPLAVSAPSSAGQVLEPLPPTQEATPPPVGQPVASRDQPEPAPSEKEPPDRPEQLTRQATASGKRSHFVPVSEEELDQMPSEEPARPWISWQTWVLVGCLLAVGGTVWYLLQPPSADALYERIARSAQEGTLEALRTAESAIQEFLTRYPSDPRAEQVRQYERELDLDRLERRFELQASGRLRSRGVLSPCERVYAEAVAISRTNPELGIAQLQALLALYEDRPERSGPTGACLELARRRLQRLQQELQEQVAGAVQVLEERLRRAEQLESSHPEAARAIRQAIVQLYGEKPWAGAVVARAKAALARSTTPASPKPPAPTPPP
jgi:serine/threonine protein kinase